MAKVTFEVYTPFPVDYFSPEEFPKSTCTEKWHKGCRDPESWKSKSQGYPDATPKCGYCQGDTPVRRLGREAPDNYERCHRIRVTIEDVAEGETSQEAPEQTDWDGWQSLQQTPEEKVP